MATKTEKEIKTEEPEIAEEGERKVIVKLPLDPASGNADVFVSVNDRNFLIKRGINVEVPECVAEVLAESERRQMEAYESANGFVIG